jgi:TIR domain-containing protein
MKARSSPRLSVTVLITILVAFLATLGSILGNIATSSIPSFLLPYVRFAWPALGVVFLLGVIVSVIQVRRDALSSSSSSRSISSSPVPALAAPSTNTSEYHSCILSYATEDQDFAEKLHADLTSKGVSCWFAPHDLKTGDKLRDKVYEAIQRQDKLLIVLSEHAIGSLWVEEEVDVALDREHQQKGTYLLFPIRLDDQMLQTGKAWAIAVRQRYIGDFRQWTDDAMYQRALQRLLRDMHK